MKQHFPLPIGTVHIIGIGGIGMSGYAEVLHNMGYAVQGSDKAESANVARLQKLGLRVIVGHAAANVLDAEGRNCAVVVRSTAVKDDNAEVVAAREKGIPVIPRVELLAELMRSFWCVNVSGTHGKTTTTSMIGHVLDKAGLDPTVINGGIINAYGSNTRMGASKWMVVESDESDGTFAKLPSVISVITNIDPEHLDYYGTFDELKDTFVAYIHNLPFYGVAVACIDHPVVRALMPQFARRVITYGFSEDADVRGANLRPTPQGLVCDVQFSPRLAGFTAPVVDMRLPVFGAHNVLNALSAFAVAHDMGVKAETVAAALSTFAGVKRRFTTMGIVNGVTIIDDYGHHPVEIESVLKAAREALQGHKGKDGHEGRVIAVIQPHRYSRLSSLWDGFCNCAALADEVIVADVYEAGEKPLPGIDKAALAAGIRATGKERVHTLDSPQALPALVHKIARPGDFIICLGAGDITYWAQALPHALEELYGIAPVSANGKK